MTTAVALALAAALLAGPAQAGSAPAAGWSVETTPIRDLVRHPEAKAALESAAPQLATRYRDVGALTPGQFATASPGALDAAALQRLQAEFDRIGAEAARLQTAAQAGRAEAQYELAKLYVYDGDDDAALRWFRKAADQGHPDAQRSAALMLSAGRGAPKNEAEATRWLLKAAEQGHVQAQADLGLRYDRGIGVAEDDAEAARWWRRAAAQGSDTAKAALARLGER